MDAVPDVGEPRSGREAVAARRSSRRLQARRFACAAVAAFFAIGCGPEVDFPGDLDVVRDRGADDGDGGGADADADSRDDAGTDIADADAEARPNTFENCPVFPSDNWWNLDISNLPVHENSDDFIASIGADVGMHPDFGTEWEGAPSGIPYVVVPSTQPLVDVTFIDFPEDSDPGPYPIPEDAPIEGGPESIGDRHVLVFVRGDCMLYELWKAAPAGGGAWEAGSGAMFDLRSNDLRPDFWTSADAAGLPIFPGLVRYDEVMDDRVIDHALRFTAEFTQRGFIHPATHFASDDTDPDLPPMGLRLRLKDGFDISGFPSEVRVILTALKKYGMMLADNGSNWYLSGVPDPRWSDDDLSELRNVHGHDFEVVYSGPVITE